MGGREKADEAENVLNIRKTEGMGRMTTRKKNRELWDSRMDPLVADLLLPPDREGRQGWEHWDGTQEPIQGVFPSSLRNGWWHRHHFGETLL